MKIIEDVAAILIGLFMVAVLIVFVLPFVALAVIFALFSFSITFIIWLCGAKISVTQKGKKAGYIKWFKFYPNK